MNDFISIFEGTDVSTVSTSVKLLILLTILGLAPSILIMLTCFTRIVIVLSFVRTALGTQQIPPNQIIIGLSLFLTFFIMTPVFTEVHTVSLKPLLADEIGIEESYEKASVPIKEFLSKHTRQKDLELFLSFGDYEKPSSVEDIPLTALVPAFAISELKTAFQMGFMIFVPFLIIDFIVSSVLMTMGMMMLPPIIISLPFKILLFILVDGWHIVIKSLFMSFGGG